MNTLLLFFQASLNLFYWGYYLSQTHGKPQSHSHVRYLVVCASRLEGADSINRPSACHHPSLAVFQIVAFLSVNRNPVILKYRSYLRTNMVFVSLPTPYIILSVLITSFNDVVLPHSAVPTCHQHWSVVELSMVKSSRCESVWEDSDIFEVCSNWSISLKIPWKFCKAAQTKPCFWFTPNDDV